MKSAARLALPRRARPGRGRPEHSDGGHRQEDENAEDAETQDRDVDQDQIMSDVRTDRMNSKISPRENLSHPTCLARFEGTVPGFLPNWQLCRLQMCQLRWYCIRLAWF